MQAIVEAESTLTERYQTTVPETVRRALGLSKRDKIHYTVQSDGQVVLTRAAVTEEEDPVVGQFLHFLARDMTGHPDRLQGLDQDLVGRIHALVGEVALDLDTPLSAEDE